MPMPNAAPIPTPAVIRRASRLDIDRGSGTGLDLQLNQTRPDLIDVVTADPSLLDELDLADIASHALVDVDDLFANSSRGTLLLAHRAQSAVLDARDAAQRHQGEDAEGSAERPPATGRGALPSCSAASASETVCSIITIIICC